MMNWQDLLSLKDTNVNMYKYNYSFIIPHKNCPELLKRCMDSIPVRDDVQVIVVDDNSDELKKPSLPKRKGLEIVLLDASQSKGAGRARNVGMKKAEGKWLLFPDSDDYYVEGFIEVLDGYRESNADVVYFGAEYKDGETGKPLKKPFYMNDIALYDGKSKSLEAIRFHHKVPWTKLVSHNFIRTNNICFEEVPNGNDILFSISVGFLGKNFLVERRALYVYIKNKESLVNETTFNEEKKLCRIIHTFQYNRFNDFINHPEWKTSIIKQIAFEIKQSGLQSAIPMFLTLFRNRRLIKNAVNKWVDLLANMKKT